MSEPTKACNLTKDELQELLRYNGLKLFARNDDAVDRINYLSKRLKEFDKMEISNNEAQAAADANNGWR